MQVEINGRFPGLILAISLNCLPAGTLAKAGHSSADWNPATLYLPAAPQTATEKVKLR